MLTVELLSFSPASSRAMDILRALHRTMPGSRVSTEYRGESDVLVLWGPGAADRWPVMQAQVAKGGHVLALDLAYWQRDRKFRVSIDAAHPQAWVMRQQWPGDRLKADRVPIGNVWKPNGPMIVAGIGRKARQQYGDAVDLWERQMIALARERWPERRILYRRKQADAPVPSDVPLTGDRPIDQVLSGASLLITWHSNVAVDAIRLGIPVICRDGAAAAICPSSLAERDQEPLPPHVRDQFLRNLAWFQWSQQEGRQFWAWVPKVLA